MTGNKLKKYTVFLNGEVDLLCYNEHEVHAAFHGGALDGNIEWEISEIEESEWQ